MKTNPLILAAAAAAIALPAFAQGGHPGGPHRGDPGPQAIPLAQAVATAERTVGGRAFDAELDRKPAGLVYEIDLVKNGRAVEVHVDAASGRVVRQERRTGPRMPFTGEHLKVAQSAPRTLSQTISHIERSTKGRVTEIGLERKGGRYYYEAELAGARDREVRVDLRTGAITPVID